MVDKMCSLPQDTTKEIHQIRVRWPSQAKFGLNGYSWPLQSLDKLCLDRFTVLFDKTACGTDIIIQAMFELATRGRGWKELHCLTQFLNFIRLQKGPTQQSIY